MYITTNQEIVETYGQVLQHENTLFGELMFGQSKFRNAHNILEVRARGIQDKIEKIKKEHFVLEPDGQIKQEEIAPEKEGDKPTKKPVCVEGKTLEQYQEAMKILLTTKIEIR